jgi:hypothetical protein
MIVARSPAVIVAALCSSRDELGIISHLGGMKDLPVIVNTPNECATRLHLEARAEAPFEMMISLVERATTPPCFIEMGLVRGDRSNPR